MRVQRTTFEHVLLLVAYNKATRFELKTADYTKTKLIYDKNLKIMYFLFVYVSVSMVYG